MQIIRLLIIAFLFLVFSPSTLADTNDNPVIRELELLAENESATVEERDGWLIVNIQSENKVWFFALGKQPAAPSYVKRFPVTKNGSIYIETKVICGVQKSECDELISSFISIDKKIKNELSLSKD